MSFYEMEQEIACLHMQVTDLTAERDALAQENKRLREALEKIADNNSCYGPFPEANNPAWGAMAIVTAREAIATVKEKS